MQSVRQVLLLLQPPSAVVSAMGCVSVMVGSASVAERVRMVVRGPTAGPSWGVPYRFGGVVEWWLLAVGPSLLGWLWV